MAKKDKKANGAASTETVTAEGTTAETATTQEAAAPSRNLVPGQIIEKKRGGETIATLRVTTDGKFEYNGSVYSSISAAALACAKNLGLSSKTLNGWAFWGLAKRPVSNGTPRVRTAPAITAGSPLARLVAQYEIKANELLERPGADNRTKVRNEILSHAQQLATFADKILSSVKQLPA